MSWARRRRLDQSPIRSVFGEMGYHGMAYTECLMTPLGFGTATLGREVGEADSFKLLDTAFEMGIRHFDTAEAYGGGNARAYRRQVLGLDDVREASGTMHSSELILGRWIRSRNVRAEVVLATKVSSGFDAVRVRQALAGSMERLQVDRLDVYYLHSVPKDVPLEEPLGVLAEERFARRIGSIGVCNINAAQLEQARQAAGGIGWCQNPFNLVQAAGSRESLTYCSANGIAFAAYSPLAAGFLTGKYGARGEKKVKGTRFDVIPAHEQVYFTATGFEALASLEAASTRTGVPKHLLAMAWVLRQPGLSVVLVGATRTEHLQNAVQAQALALSSPELDGFGNR